jgi:HEPN domain-containing protein
VAFGDKALRRLKERAFARIIAAIRFRIAKVVREPSVTELEFISLTVNHGQFSEKLRQLGLPTAGEGIQKNAFHVGLRWMKLAEEHLDDAAVSLAAGRKRSTFSRSYYAAYNASKAVRYIVGGAVSLKGDDHLKASDLPNDFPSAVRWAEMIPKLYEHRLLSDYDNWDSTESQHSLTPSQAHELAGEFLLAAKSYLLAKFGI